MNNPNQSVLSKIQKIIFGSTFLFALLYSLYQFQQIKFQETDQVVRFIIEMFVYIAFWSIIYLIITSKLKNHISSLQKLESQINSWADLNFKTENNNPKFSHQVTTEVQRLNKVCDHTQDKLSESNQLQNTQIENLKSTIEHAKTISESKSHFLNTLSQELRTPLNAIINMGDLLEEETSQKEKESMLKTVNTSSRSLLTVIENIVDYSKLISNDIKVRQSPNNLRTLFLGLQTQLQSSTQQSNVTLNIHFPQEINSHFVCDGKLFQQILLNLLENAIKFNPNCVIDLSIEELEGDLNTSKLEFKVIDNGSGITPKVQEEIISSIVHSEKINPKKQGSLGFGLPIVQKILKLMDSELIITSKLRQGTSIGFIVELSKYHSKESEVEHKDITDISKLNILIAEDNRINQKVITKVFSKWGIQPTLVKNGKLALEMAIAPDSAFDLILMDLHMPIMDGFDATTQIKELGITTPIYALTADTSEATRQKIDEIKFDGFFSKPFKPKELFKALEKL